MLLLLAVRAWLLLAGCVHARWQAGCSLTAWCWLVAGYYISGRPKPLKIAPLTLYF
jgi:hypothetical protein